MARSGKPGRIKQLRQAYQVTKKGDPKIGLVLLGTFLFAAVVGTALMFLIPPTWLPFDILTGVLIGVLAALIVFGRRAQTSQVKQIEGQPGAALAVLGMLRRGWKTDQMVAFNKQQDIVHRVVGPPGIVLVGEGAPHRVRGLIAQEKKKIARVAGDTPIYDVTVGTGEGDVRLGKLNRYLLKLPSNLSRGEVAALDKRLAALGGGSRMPLPQGPMPQGAKMRNVQRTVRRRS